MIDLEDFKIEVTGCLTCPFFDLVDDSCYFGGLYSEVADACSDRTMPEECSLRKGSYRVVVVGSPEDDEEEEA